MATQPSLLIFGGVVIAIKNGKAGATLTSS
jgi:hypothetical protein